MRLWKYARRRLHGQNREEGGYTVRTAKKKEGSAKKTA
jgi:hypothetical protein